MSSLTATAAEDQLKKKNGGPVEEAGVHYFVIIPSSSETTENNNGPAKQARIGIKRYAGLYCNNCHVSVLKEGEESARYAGKVHAEHCALCNAPTNGKDGTISECNCFDWHMAPHRLQQCFANNKVIDSYGTSFSVPFLLEKLIGTCPIQFYDKIEPN